MLLRRNELDTADTSHRSTPQPAYSHFRICRPQTSGRHVGQPASSTMLFDEAHTEELKAWLTSELGPICDADPEVLADYVLALLKHESSEAELQALLTEQLEDFLAAETEPFVAKIFQAIADKAYFRENQRLELKRPHPHTTLLPTHRHPGSEGQMMMTLPMRPHAHHQDRLDDWQRIPRRLVRKTVVQDVLESATPGKGMQTQKDLTPMARRTKADAGQQTQAALPRLSQQGLLPARCQLQIRPFAAAAATTVPDGQHDGPWRP